jgi:HAE1 family hydrophobic/amphiphilic exporter-1
MSLFFIRRPVVAIVLALATILLGIVAVRGLPVAQFPQILPPQIAVTTSYSGADAFTVEQAVATPIEQQMNGVDNSLYIQSTSANDGSLSQLITFDVGTNLDTANVLVNNRFAQAQPFLPQDVKNFGVTIKKSLAFPIVFVSLYSPDGRYDSTFLANYASINITDALTRIKGVGDVRNFGAADYALRIWLDPERLARFELTVGDVQAAIRAQNTVNPAGQIGGEPAMKGQQLTYTVRAKGRAVTPDDFAAIILRTASDGSIIRVKDVAKVELGALTYGLSSTFEGRSSAVLGIFQTPGSNALEVSRAIRATLAEASQRFPQGVAYHISLDTTAPISAGIREIVITLLEAIGLVVLVVFVFLQSWRATLIPLLTVPVSLVGAFALFPLFGFSINTLSLFGLVLAIGLVVDDAIVVVEAVEHHIETGMTPRDATVAAMKQVQGPVIAIALILAAVFVPVAFMSGITGRLYQQFALTIAISVLISAFNALTLSPALASMLLRPRGERSGFFGRLGKRFDRAFRRATDGYVSINRRLMRKVAIPLVLLGGVAAMSVRVGTRLPAGFLPDEDQGYGLYTVQLPEDASLERTKQVIAQVDQILAKEPGVASYNGVAGFGILTRTAAPYMGFGFFVLTPWDERSQTAAEIVGDLNRKLAQVSTARIFAINPPAIPGISASGGFSLMIQDRSGGDYSFLVQNVGKFLAAVQKRPEIARAFPNFVPAVPQYYASVDEEKAAAKGVALTDIYAALQTFLGGAYVNDFLRFGRQWRVFVQAEASSRRQISDISKLYVRNTRGEMAPLSTFVTLKPISGPEYTVRFNLYRAVEIIGSPAPGYSSGQALDALEEVAKQTLPPEMGIAWNGLSYQERQASGGTAKTLGLALVFVFLILAALYESWSLPFAVLLSTPVAIFGAFLGLLSRHYDNNVYAQIGLVVLVGLAAKNAILIVEFAKDAAERGATALDAALEAARLRLRPILMTSFAFICGCIPLWTASGAGAGARTVLGTAVISGMLAATLLGIFFIPSLFLFVHRLAHRRSKIPPAYSNPLR